jgi:hypothetical protein
MLEERNGRLLLGECDECGRLFPHGLHRWHMRPESEERCSGRVCPVPYVREKRMEQALAVAVDAALDALKAREVERNG